MSELDELILYVLSVQPHRFYELQHNAQISAEIQRLEQLSGREGWRILDSRLIALRKKKAIKPDRKIGWSLEK